MQVNSRKQTMDTQFFSPLLGTVSSPSLAPELCDWPGCAEDFGSQTAFQECPKKRYQHSCSVLGASGSLKFLCWRTNVDSGFFLGGGVSGISGNSDFLCSIMVVTYVVKKCLEGSFFFLSSSQEMWQNIYCLFWRELGDNTAAFIEEMLFQWAFLIPHCVFFFFFYHLLHKDKILSGEKLESTGSKVTLKEDTGIAKKPFFFFCFYGKCQSNVYFWIKDHTAWVSAVRINFKQGVAIC